MHNFKSQSKSIAEAGATIAGSTKKKDPFKIQNVAQQIHLAENLQKQLHKKMNHISKSEFPVLGYSNDENIWQKIMEIRSDKSKNRPSRQNIKVNERIVRCKNCFYAPFEQTD